MTDVVDVTTMGRAATHCLKAAGVTRKGNEEGRMRGMLGRSSKVPMMVVGEEKVVDARSMR